MTTVAKPRTRKKFTLDRDYGNHPELRRVYDHIPDLFPLKDRKAIFKQLSKMPHEQVAFGLSRAVAPMPNTIEEVLYARFMKVPKKALIVASVHIFSVLLWHTLVHTPNDEEWAAQLVREERAKKRAKARRLLARAKAKAK